MHNIRQVFLKEFNGFFASPAAWLFLGVFLIVTLFFFFWGEAFFARNIADVKPLFEWMPVLQIFLVSALTMRSWSEERRSGTLESLLTSPVSSLQLVLGKFSANLALVALALALTLPLPLTVSLLGPLDWGPVFGAYIASLFLAAAYIAIGLYMSARTDNPIVALIMTVAVTGIFYLIGTSTLTTLFGHYIGGVMELIGSGSRFESITRGVLDIRDIYYYLSIIGIFLVLNLYTLEKIRWSTHQENSNHKQWRLFSGLLVANFVLANFWFNAMGSARIDLTQGNIYSLSPATGHYIQQLQEPLLIRGYFSAKSHPLLEPLVPQIRDLLEEYQVVGGKRVTVEFVDPHTDQALEEEAAEKYSIRPVPFRMASRYEAGVVNSYFDLVVAYGDQYETLSFDDLIEIKVQGNSDPEVLLKNPEYALTRAIRKVTSSYQAGGNVFADLAQPLQFNAYISTDSQLPNVLAELKKQLKETLDNLKQASGDKLAINFADPDANGGELAKQLQEKHGLGPQIASLFDPKPFWFYMMLEGKGETVQIPLPKEMNQDTLKKSIEAAVQRMSPGYLKTVVMVKPVDPMAMNPYMRAAGNNKTYQNLETILKENVRLKESDLADGQVPADADLLLVLAPKNLSDKQLFAIDQFLMQGGSIILASSPFDITISNSINAQKQISGLEEWLKHHGISMDESMVLDPQNASLPIPVRRNIGPISVNEIQMMPYPHFPDIRTDGLDNDNAMTSALGQLSLNWVSPINLDEEKNKQRQVSRLLHSSPNSWVSSDLNMVPDYRIYPDNGFATQSERGSKLLAVAVQGSFESYFKGKQSPLIESKAESDKKPDEEGKADNNEEKAEEKTVVSGVIERSSDSARIILIASNTFANDTVISLASQGQGNAYTRPLEFVQNAVDWSLDDQGLLAIRSRAQLSRILAPLQQGDRVFWEYLNYTLALLGLGAVALWRRQVHKRKQQHYEKLLALV